MVNLKLIEVLNERGMKQKDLGYMIKSKGGKMDSPLISRIIKGKYPPNARHRYWISRILDIPEQELF